MVWLGIVGEGVGSGRVELGHLLADLEMEVVLDSDDGGEGLDRQVAAAHQPFVSLKTAGMSSGEIVRRSLRQRLGERDAEFSFGAGRA